MPKHRNKGDSNPGSLNRESDILPLITLNPNPPSIITENSAMSKLSTAKWEFAFTATSTVTHIFQMTITLVVFDIEYWLAAHFEGIT